MRLMSTLAFVVCLLSVSGAFADEGLEQTLTGLAQTVTGRCGDNLFRPPPRVGGSDRRLRSFGGGCEQCQAGSYRTGDMADDHCQCSNGQKWCPFSGCCDGSSDDFTCVLGKCAPIPACADQATPKPNIEGTCQDKTPKNSPDGVGDTVVYGGLIAGLFPVSCPLPSTLTCALGAKFTLYVKDCTCAEGNIVVECNSVLNLGFLKLCVAPEPEGPGVVNGDPHFTGFDGSKFDFKGTNGDVYNILSHNNHQVNARFGTIADINGTDNGLWLMGFGIRHGNMNFSINIDLPQDFVPEVWMDPESLHATHMRMRIPEGKNWLSLTLNGHDISEGFGSGSYSPQKTGAMIYFPDHTQKNKDDKYDGPIAVLRTGDMQFTFYVETEDVIHLDVSTEILSKNITSMHGVLGQTFHWVNTQNITRQIEGTDEDYLVKDGLLGTDFTFNQFKARGGLGRHMGRRLAVPESSSGLFAASGGDKTRVAIPDITM